MSSRRTLLVPLVVGLVASLTVVAAGTTTAADDGPHESVRALRIEGRGHGHGIGLSQWGAYTMARQGAHHPDILATFYPGTVLGSAGGEVVVTVDERTHSRIAFPRGGELRSSRSGAEPAPGFPISVAPGAVMVVRAVGSGYEVVGTTAPAAGGPAVAYQTPGCLLLCPSTTTTTAPPAQDPPDDDDGEDGAPGEKPPSTDDGDPTTATSSHPVSPGPVWAVPAEGGTVQSVDRDRTYRGVIEVTGTERGLALRNHVDIETYLMGMAEVPGNWPTEALAAQTIAARTFALRAGTLCDSDRCQVYVGTAGESPGQTAAVEATRGVVVTYQGGLAATHYSASAGGISATPAEGFGMTGEVPYLQAIEHPDVNPQPWQREVSMTDAGRALGYPGEMADVHVDLVGPSGRALTITMQGDAGPVPVDPNDFRRRLDLRSSFYELATVDGANPPPIPRVEASPDVVGNPTVGDASHPMIARPWVTFGPAEATSRSVRGLPLAGAFASLTAAICLGTVAVRRRDRGRVAGWPPPRR